MGTNSEQMPLGFNAFDHRKKLKQKYEEELMEKGIFLNP